MHIDNLILLFMTALNFLKTDEKNYTRLTAFLFKSFTVTRHIGVCTWIHACAYTHTHTLTDPTIYIGSIEWQSKSTYKTHFVDDAILMYYYWTKFKDAAKYPVHSPQTEGSVKMNH